MISRHQEVQIKAELGSPGGRNPLRSGGRLCRAIRPPGLSPRAARRHVSPTRVALVGGSRKPQPHRIGVRNDRVEFERAEGITRVRAAHIFLPICKAIAIRIEVRVGGAVEVQPELPFPRVRQAVAVGVQQQTADGEEGSEIGPAGAHVPGWRIGREPVIPLHRVEEERVGIKIVCAGINVGSGDVAVGRRDGRAVGERDRSGVAPEDVLL